MTGQSRQSQDRGEALIAILNNPDDLAILQHQGWYRIPVRTAPKRWPPKLLAFYQTQIFGDEAYAVRYYGSVREIREVGRSELFPHEAPNAKSDKRYYQIHLDGLNTLPQPIISHRWRRIVFIPTTIEKLWLAEEINDLFDDSPLENRLWSTLKTLRAEAERQWRVEVDRRRYYLDFALFCRWGRIDVETDGDSWHVNRVDAARDNRRDADLQTSGWQVLRFTTAEVHKRMESHCAPVIERMAEHLSGFGVPGPYPPIDVNNIIMCEAPEEYQMD
ncbi:MAG: endonuclease domain-containing protein [Anaerolineae bacterium]|nr:endonuclease domain-containing protein [Anaerolineae bacterium]